MALTESEETKVRELLAAVEASGVSMAQVTATLRVGKLTTEQAVLTAKLEQARLEQKAANETAEAQVQAITVQQNAKAAELRALLGDLAG